MSAGGRRPLLLHVTTVDMSLALLLGPQLRAYAEEYEVVGASAPGPYVAELEAAGVRHVALRHATRAMSPLDDARLLGELAALFRRLRPDIVHTHNPKPGVYGRLAARASAVPAIVNTVHGLYALPEDSRSKRAVVYGLERLAASCSHAELVQNPEDIETLVDIGVPRHKLHLLGNGVDLWRFDPGRIDPAHTATLRRQLGAGPDDVVCGLVGRLVWEKGYREVFAAAASLRRRLPHLRIVVIGPQDHDKADAVREADLEAARRDGVTFLGLRHDVEDLYAAMDLYVLASHREGFPRSAMEAAAMALPVVATDIRGCRQVVEHGSTGFLVPPRQGAPLADAIATLVEGPALRRSMGEAGRHKACAEFDQRQVIETTFDVYHRLASEHAPRRVS